MNKEEYLSHLHSDGAQLLDAATRDLSAPVSGCPGWNAGVLTGHIGYVWMAWTGNLRARGKERAPLRPQDLAGWPGMWEWIEADMPADGVPAGVTAWAAAQLRALEAELEAADPAQPCWTWFAADQTAGFPIRRMAQETAVHRWDAQSATGTPEPIDGELARDGIDEMFDVFLSALSDDPDRCRGAGETYHFHRTDGEGEWLLRFEPDGVVVSHEHAKADVAVRGTASDLLLFVWGRVPADRLEVFGDRALLDRYFELVPPD